MIEQLKKENTSVPPKLDKVYDVYTSLYNFGNIVCPRQEN